MVKRGRERSSPCWPTAPSFPTATSTSFPSSSRPLSHGAPIRRPPGAGCPPSSRPTVPPSFAPAAALRILSTQHRGAPEKGPGRPLVRAEGLGSGVRDWQEVPWSCWREGGHPAWMYVVLFSLSYLFHLLCAGFRCVSLKPLCMGFIEDDTICASRLDRELTWH